MRRRQRSSSRRVGQGALLPVLLLAGVAVGGFGYLMRTARAATPMPAEATSAPPASSAPSAVMAPPPPEGGSLPPLRPAPAQLATAPSAAPVGRLLMTPHRQAVLRQVAGGPGPESAALRQQVVHAVQGMRAAMAAGGGGNFTLRDQLINAALVVNACPEVVHEDDVDPAVVATTVVAFARHLQHLKPQNAVARGAMTVSLAMAYDALYTHFDAAQRRDVAQALIDQAMVIALGGSYRPRGSGRRQWWADSATNWSTLIIGGSVLSALAIRDDDAPQTITASAGDATDRTYTWDEVRRVALVDGLEHLRRCFLPIVHNGGGTNEGHGYHHDMLLPLMLVAEAVHLRQHSAEVAPLVADVQRFLAQALEGARWQVQGDIHVATPLPGVDFDYADGTWSLSDQPVTYLVATWARRAQDSAWQAGAWMAEQRCTKPTAMRAIFRSDVAWSAAPSPDVAGMAGFAPATIPTGAHLYREPIPAGEPGTNEHLVVWRQRFADPLAAALMFKGGDRRQDRHSALDAGTFTYVGQGVLWNRRPGWIGDYRYYYRDNRTSGPDMTFLHLFAKRAEAQNTLVVNPQDNDYLQGRIPAPMTWLEQVNPDQAVGEDRISTPLSPVVQVEMPARGAWSAAIRYAPAYARHGVVEARGDAHSERRLQFDPATGRVEVRDHLLLERPAGNAVTWGMYLSPEVAIEAMSADRVLVSAPSIDHRRVYLAVRRLGAGPDFQVRQGADLATPGVPSQDVRWRYLNADLHRRTSRKLVLADAAVGERWTVAVELFPLPDLAGMTANDAQQRWQALVPSAAP